MRWTTINSCVCILSSLLFNLYAIVYILLIIYLHIIVSCIHLFKFSKRDHHPIHPPSRVITIGWINLIFLTIIILYYIFIYLFLPWFLFYSMVQIVLYILSGLNKKVQYNTWYHSVDPAILLNAFPLDDETRFFICLMKIWFFSFFKRLGVTTYFCSIF